MKAKTAIRIHLQNVLSLEELRGEHPTLQNLREYGCVSWSTINDSTAHYANGFCFEINSELQEGRWGHEVVVTTLTCSNSPTHVTVEVEVSADEYDSLGWRETISRLEDEL
ncbi:uncharacterized protein PFL1_00321 [Pseudozyma flocculosa PF-1]|uniref:Uncharacterized protein n=1 Tax=Pseudozyma flocculosa TaxID=84751 RepID=A0A5C3ESW4_9BASI|nr:uncharacterized protein PFL1_00321 [Pseudozyma flocculosa PF-1]EPQ32124.1 hypothetical protein PFL1_00321 [Pseudozyma flocculosa PF-1]SPO34940.1 uncharacterized protein PSFLO_00411 [Pseudozyma flocculosa]